MQALLLSKNPDELTIMALLLQRAGLTVNSYVDPERATLQFPEHPVDLVMLVWEQNLILWARRFRALTQVPILVVAQVDEDLHCALLEEGVDWVIPRPFSMRVLIAQIRALLRRSGTVQMFTLPNLDIAGIRLDPATRTVSVQDHQPRRLTQLEFRLLYTLMVHRGQILTTETIVGQVWGYNGRGDKELVRGLVRRLRAKVEPDPSTPNYIITVPGVGYCFQPTESFSDLDM